MARDSEFTKPKLRDFDTYRTTKSQKNEYIIQTKTGASAVGTTEGIKKSNLYCANLIIIVNKHSNIAQQYTYTQPSYNVLEFQTV